MTKITSINVNALLFRIPLHTFQKSENILAKKHPMSRKYYKNFYAKTESKIKTKFVPLWKKILTAHVFTPNLS
jgi:hypothetical protein